MNCDSVRSDSSRLSLEDPQNAIQRAADQQVRNDGKNERDDHRLAWIKPAQNDGLIDGIHDERDCENFADCCPALL